MLETNLLHTAKYAIRHFGVDNVDGFSMITTHIEAEVADKEDKVPASQSKLSAMAIVDIM